MTRVLLTVLSLASFDVELRSESGAYTHFEARQTHSIALTPNGTRVLAVNSPAGTLIVFQIESGGDTLTKIDEIPVGLEPVAVAARTDDEVWVVNEVSDSVSIVSLSRKAVIATLSAEDEPADIVFAEGKAYVSCARNGLLRVFDAVTRAALPSIGLAGVDPRALATNSAGSIVYAAFLHSGNGTTILPRSDAPAQPTPTNPGLPNPPDAALIVASDDPRIAHTVADRDVAVIDTNSGLVSHYIGGVGTTLFGMAEHPLSGNLWVVNTEALNIIRFEPALRGHFLEHRLTRISAGSHGTTVFDLNGEIDYGVLPNAGAQAITLSQPTAIAIEQTGDAWVAAFASDRVAKIALASGEILNRIDLRSRGGNSAVMRGPRALALHPSLPRLYVLNKISDTVSVIDTESASLVSEVPLNTHDAMPSAIRKGRGLLFDARLSGNGTVSCAGCHVDADRDALAWDLGDPGGEMVTVFGANLAAHDLTPRPRVMHPMKGPMVTQTLRGMQAGAPFHWRGDRPTLQSFNPTFHRLMGGAELDSAEIDLLAEYLLSLRNHPNPNRTRNGALPSSFAGGNPVRGEMLFNQHDNHCGICHLQPKGTDNNIDLHQEVGASQPIKNPPLGTVYQKLLFDPRPGGISLSGFGLLHDGTGSGLALPTVHPYVLDVLATSADFLDVQAFVLCFDTGTSPTVGDSITVNVATRGAADETLTSLELLPPGTVQLVVHATIEGVQRRFIYSRALQRYIPQDLTVLPLTRHALLDQLGPDDSMTFLGVPPLEAARFGGTNQRNAAASADSYFLKNARAAISVSPEQGVLANDVNVAATHDSTEIVLGSGKGEVLLNADGSFTYTPSDAFAEGSFDHFQYKILVAGDPGNATTPSSVTLSTLASAAGQYAGVISNNLDQQPAGYVSFKLSRNGAWTGSVRTGSEMSRLKGTVGMDGVLEIKGVPAHPVMFRLTVSPAGERKIIAGSGDGSGEDISGEISRTPFSKRSPAPNVGKHSLVLTVKGSSGTAPFEPGSGKVKLTSAGGILLTGKLGDGTAYSCRGVVAPGQGGGWQFPFYAAVYKSPAGTVSGLLEFTPDVSEGIRGCLKVVKPPQSRPEPFQTGFTIEYDAAEVKRRSLSNFSIPPT